MLYIQIDIRHLCLASIANYAMADFKENIEDMVGTREAAGGDRVRRGRDRVGDRRRRMRRRRPVS